MLLLTAWIDIAQLQSGGDGRPRADQTAQDAVQSRGDRVRRDMSDNVVPADPVADGSFRFKSSRNRRTQHALVSVAGDAARNARIRLGATGDNDPAQVVPTIGFYHQVAV